MASIRLTKTMRQEICQKIMADVPKENYVLQTRKLVEEEMYKLLSPEVKHIHDTEKTLLMVCQVRIPYPKQTKSVWVDLRGFGYSVDVPADIKNKAMSLLGLEETQQKHRDELEQKVMATLNAYTYVHKLRNDCPQFDKYLPNEAAINYPVAVVGSPIPDLILAGWPKGKTTP